MKTSYFYLPTSLFALFYLSVFKILCLMTGHMNVHKNGNINNPLFTKSEDQFIITGTSYLLNTIDSVSTPLVLPFDSDHKKNYNVFTGLSTSKDDSNSFSFFEVSSQAEPESTFTLHHSKFCLEDSEKKSVEIMEVKWVAIQTGTYFSLQEDNNNCLATGTINLKGPSYKEIIDTSSLASCTFATSFENAIIIVQSQVSSSKKGIVSFLATSSVNSQNEIEVSVSSLNDENLPETIPVGYLLIPHDFKFSDEKKNVAIQGYLIDNENSYTVALESQSQCGAPIVLSSPTYLTKKTFLAPRISPVSVFSTLNVAMQKVILHNEKINCPALAKDTSYAKRSIIVIQNEQGCSINSASNFLLYDSLSSHDNPTILTNMTLLWVLLGAVGCVLAISSVLYITYGKKRVGAYST